MAKASETKVATVGKDGLARGAKSNAIREFHKANPEAKTKDIAAAVTQQLGSQVTEGLVAQVIKGTTGTKRRKKELSGEEVLTYLTEIGQLGGLEEVKASLVRVQRIMTLTEGDVGKAMEVVEMLLKHKEALEPLLAKKEQAA